MENQIFNKFQSDLMKRAFGVEGDGSCVRLSVAEDVLRRAIRECMNVKAEPRYDFWGQPLQADKGV